MEEEFQMPGNFPYSAKAAAAYVMDTSIKNIEVLETYDSEKLLMMKLHGPKVTFDEALAAIGVGSLFAKSFALDPDGDRYRLSGMQHTRIKCLDNLYWDPEDFFREIHRRYPDPTR